MWSIKYGPSYVKLSIKYGPPYVVYYCQANFWYLRGLDIMCHDICITFTYNFKKNNVKRSGFVVKKFKRRRLKFDIES